MHSPNITLHVTKQTFKFRSLNGLKIRPVPLNVLIGFKPTFNFLEGI